MKHASLRRLAKRVALLLFGTLPLAAAAAPAQVTVVGNFQSELGCASDWQPDCNRSGLVGSSVDGVWRGMFDLPAGAYEYKVAIDRSWVETYGAHGERPGTNIGLGVLASGTVGFWYDAVTHWIADSISSRIVTAAGNFQSELGCPGDWQPSCLRSWLEDIDGDGIYTFDTALLPAGAYETKAALREGWDENYGVGGMAGGASIGFVVPYADAPMRFRFDTRTNVLDVSLIAPAAIPEPGTAALLALGLLAMARRRRN